MITTLSFLTMLLFSICMSYNLSATLLNTIHLVTDAGCRVVSPHRPGNSSRLAAARIPRLGFTIFLLAHILL